jgi:nicotinate-nucleotide adenylyltransferase
MEREPERPREPADSSRHIGVFGGTFDPVHVGHLILAEQCREQARLDQILFVPAARPPHKHERAL